LARIPGASNRFNGGELFLDVRREQLEPFAAREFAHDTPDVFHGE
jgi:hypothetical protein